jgi:hypothetical protein
MPSWLLTGKVWSSLESAVSLRAISRHSFSLENTLDFLNPESSHVSCHKVVYNKSRSFRQISYVKSDCDSGFVCIEFSRKSDRHMTAVFGEKSAEPGEACSDLYFSNDLTRTLHFASPEPSETCALSGEYHLSPLSSDTLELTGCHVATPLHLVAECGASSLHMEWSCPGRNLSRVRYSCTSSWSSRGTRTHIVLSREEDNTSNSSPAKLCLTQSADGMSVSEGTCAGVQLKYKIVQTRACHGASASPLSAGNLWRLKPILLLLLLISILRWMN